MARPRGRLTEQIPVRFTPEQREALDLASETEGRSIAELVREAVELWSASRRARRGESERGGGGGE